MGCTRWRRCIQKSFGKDKADHEAASARIATPDFDTYLTAVLSKQGSMESPRERTASASPRPRTSSSKRPASPSATTSPSPSVSGSAADFEVHITSGSVESPVCEPSKLAGATPRPSPPLGPPTGSRGSAASPPGSGMGRDFDTYLTSVLNRQGSIDSSQARSPSLGGGIARGISRSGKPRASPPLKPSPPNTPKASPPSTPKASPDASLLVQSPSIQSQRSSHSTDSKHADRFDSFLAKVRSFWDYDDDAEEAEECYGYRLRGAALQRRAAEQATRLMMARNRCGCSLNNVCAVCSRLPVSRSSSISFAAAHEEHMLMPRGHTWDGAASIQVHSFGSGESIRRREQGTYARPGESWKSTSSSRSGSSHSLGSRHSSNRPRPRAGVGRIRERP